MSPKAKPITRTPFEAARRAGVPIVAIETADPAATINKCVASLNGKHEKTPLLRWDLIRGLSGYPKNLPAEVVLSAFGEELPLSEPSSCLASLVAKRDCLSFQLVDADGIPDGNKIGAIVFMVHANRWLEDTDAMQAVWNCRDAFEPIGAMLVLLGPSFKIPIELKNDLVLISEPLPGHEELGQILDKTASDADLSADKIDGREVIVDTMSGTSAFGARQILAMSITRDGVDLNQLWDRKAKVIKQTPGLSIWRGADSFNELGGLANLKSFLTRVLTSGTTQVRAILWGDEIEKQLAGAGGDLSGTSQDQMGAILSFLQDKNVPVLLLIGHPGCGKSAISKAAGSIAKAPVIAMDFGAMKGSLVGQSEQQIRSALDVAIAVSDGKLIMILTCNKLTSLPPELRRRCTLGTFFVDLPDAEERKSIWPIWLKHFDLSRSQTMPDSEGWSGAEIRACCDMAFRTGMTLIEAAKYIVPIIKSAPEQVEGLRKFASNRFISATKAGVYTYHEKQAEVSTGRRVNLD